MGGGGVFCIIRHVGFFLLYSISGSKRGILSCEEVVRWLEKIYLHMYGVMGMDNEFLR